MAAAGPVTVPYPSHRATEAVARDGSSVHVRPVRAGDGPAMRALLDEVSRESIGFRFFGTPNLEWVTAWSLDVDYADRFGLTCQPVRSADVGLGRGLWAGDPGPGQVWVEVQKVPAPVPASRIVRSRSGEGCSSSSVMPSGSRK
jgi:hypothetical protein